MCVNFRTFISSKKKKKKKESIFAGKTLQAYFTPENGLHTLKTYYLAALVSSLNC